MMSKKLTPEQIAYYVIHDLVPAEREWESVIDSAIGWNGSEDAADGARFLEQLEPGRTWTAEEYYGLMYNHFSSRWESVAYIGAIRAHEAHADGKLSGEQAGAAMASAEAAEKYIRSLAGTHVYDCGNGTVLVFDEIFNATVTAREVEGE